MLRDVADTTQALHERDRGLLDTFDPTAGSTVRPGEADRDRLERRLADLSEEDVCVTRELAGVREREHEVAALAEDLRTLARGDDTRRAHWDERSVRSAMGRLGTLEDQAGLRTEAVAERIGLAYRHWSTGTVLEGASRLQRRLRDAGPGAVSLVVTEGPRGSSARLDGYRTTVTVPTTDLPSDPIPADAIAAFGDIDQAASGAEDAPAPPTDAQAVRLARLTLRPSRVQGLIPALVELAPQETSVASPGAVPAPEQVRAYLADSLARDLDRPEARRRHWPLLEADIRRLKATLRLEREPVTDAARRELIGRLRTSEAGSDVIAALAAGRVFGLAVTLVLPDGSLTEAGTSSGRSVVLVRLPGTGGWAATLPVAPPARPDTPRTGANGAGPGRTRVVPAAFLDAPRPTRPD